MTNNGQKPFVLFPEFVILANEFLEIVFFFKGILLGGLDDGAPWEGRGNDPCGRMVGLTNQ